MRMMRALQRRKQPQATPPSTPPRSSGPGGAIGSPVANNVTPNRPRVNTRDRENEKWKRSSNRLVRFELDRSWHTDWMVEQGGWLLLAVYVGVIFIVEVVLLACMDLAPVSIPLFWSWTVAHALHLLVSIVFLHGFKGSLFDEQGELAALTLWEQLEGRPSESRISLSSSKDSELALSSVSVVQVKRTLCIVPTLLCYAACHFAGYRRDVCTFNLCVWCIHMIAKVPAMNGVRLFGINRTAGIDDDLADVVGSQHGSR